jgi:hypothetical protein
MSSEKENVLDIIDQVLRGFLGTGDYIDKAVPEYLKALESNLLDAKIFEHGDRKSISLEIDPSFFAKNYDLSNKIFPRMVKRIRKDSGIKFEIYSGQYCLDIPGPEGVVIGDIYKSGSLVSEALIKQPTFLDIKFKTSTDLAKEFIDFVDNEYSSAYHLFKKAKRYFLEGLN